MQRKKKPGIKEQVKRGDISASEGLHLLVKRASRHAAECGANATACVETALNSRTGLWLARRAKGVK